MQPLISLAVVLFLSSLRAAEAAALTNQFKDVPLQVQCKQTWTNQNVILRFTETIASEDGYGGYCNFGVGYRFVEVWPCRLALDFTLLLQPVSRIEVDIYDQCGPGYSKLFAYRGGSSIAQVANAASRNQTLVLDFTTSPPDSCAIWSAQAYVNEIRILTQTSSPSLLGIAAAAGVLTLSWPTNAAACTLEKADSLTPPLNWTAETNHIQSQGSNFVYRLDVPADKQFFRLRPN